MCSSSIADMFMLCWGGTQRSAAPASLLAGSCKTDQRERKKEEIKEAESGHRPRMLWGGNGMQLRPGCSSPPSRSYHLRLLLFTQTTARFQQVNRALRNILRKYLSTRYAPTAQLTRLTADDGFGADGRQSYGETFGKYSASSLRSQYCSSGYISSPGKLIF